MISRYFFWNRCSHTILHDVKQVLEVMNESLNNKYLGFPYDVGRSNNEAFGYLNVPIQKQPQVCMEKELSEGGKEILIKLVVQAILNYSMALFKLSRGLFKDISSMV